MKKSRCAEKVTMRQANATGKLSRPIGAIDKSFITIAQFRR